MTSSTAVPDANPRRDTAGAGWVERLARGRVLRLLEGLRTGRLTVADAMGVHHFGMTDAALPVHPTLAVHDARFWVEVATGGSLGAAESYMRGDWDCDDLVGLVRLLARHRHQLTGFDSGWARVRTPLLRALHALQRNTRHGSKSNISRHYDLGNDFFALFLDPHLMYSSALYPRPDSPLEEASTHKLDVVCRRLGLSPGMHLLEIGSGWGGLAIHAARHFGVRVTTTTISREQHREASARVEAAGLAGRVRVLQEDYRDLPRLQTRFDRVVSIEMIEAVGHEFLGTYFSTIEQLLHPRGRALVQAIVIRDQDEAAYRRSVDFIQRHIFPGGALPSVRGMTDSVARHTTLRVSHLEDLTPHYARTLSAWRERFEARLDDVRALGFDEVFIRMWRWYLAYCEAGFRERTCGLVHLGLSGAEVSSELDVGGSWTS